MNIRLASLSDAEGIARVHVQSWQTTYKGIISDVFLNNLSIEGRKENWELTFNNIDFNNGIYVVEDQGEINGFIYGGKSREPELDYEAELYAIYLLEEAQGKGHGKLLFNRLIESLKSDNYNSLMVWVLERNPSMEFYKKLGGQYITKKEINIGVDALIEAALGWEDLTKVNL
jgi:GNAT superfamily N-acetyltransferase